MVGALAGGVVTAAVGLLGLRLDYSMGWCRSRLADAPNPLSLVSEPVLFLTYLFFNAILLLVSWRFNRRFGWARHTVLFVFVVAGGPIRERMWFDKFMQVMITPFETLPMIVDGAIMAAGLTLGYVVMRIIAGPAGSDRLARTLQLETGLPFRTRRLRRTG